VSLILRRAACVFLFESSHRVLVKIPLFEPRGVPQQFGKKLVFPPKSALSTLKIHSANGDREQKALHILGVAMPSALNGTTRTIFSFPHKKLWPAHEGGSSKKRKKSTPAFHSASAVGRTAFEPLTLDRPIIYASNGENRVLLSIGKYLFRFFPAPGSPQKIDRKSQNAWHS